MLDDHGENPFRSGHTWNRSYVLPDGSSSPMRCFTTDTRKSSPSLATDRMLFGVCDTFPSSAFFGAGSVYEVLVSVMWCSTNTCAPVMRANAFASSSTALYPENSSPPALGTM